MLYHSCPSAVPSARTRRGACWQSYASCACTFNLLHTIHAQYVYSHAVIRSIKHIGPFSTWGPGEHLPPDKPGKRFHAFAAHCHLTACLTCNCCSANWARTDKHSALNAAATASNRARSSWCFCSRTLVSKRCFAAKDILSVSTSSQEDRHKA
jgi:hypothetical protein